MQARKEATRRDYTERVQRVLVFLQQNLDQDLSLEDLAKVASFSPFHFHRIFRGLVGESVQQHLRRLRLERAAGHLKASRRSVLQIALSAGYDSHEAFTRAFHRAFGHSPSDFRSANATTAIDAPSKVHLQSGSDLDFQPIDHAMSDSPFEIRKIEPLQVLFLRHVGPYDQVGASWEALCDYAGQHGLIGADTRFFGASYDDPEVTPADKLRYDACLTVGPEARAEGPYALQTLGGRNYAVALHEGPYAELGASYARLFGQLIAGSGRQPGPAPCLEFYLNDPEGTEPEDLLTEICIPIDD